MLINLDNTLEQIENEYWGNPTYESHLVTECHRLRKKPLKDFSIEDLRILIGQNISLNILIPIALERLKQNIMAEGHYYKCDLLLVVLKADLNYWRMNLNLQRTLIKLLQNNLPAIEKRVGKSIDLEIYNEITVSFEDFKRMNSK